MSTANGIEARWGDDVGMTWANADDATRERFALTRLYWFYRMVQSGGPDGSDLDNEVDGEAAIAAAWWGPRLREMADRASSGGSPPNA